MRSFLFFALLLLAGICAILAMERGPDALNWKSGSPRRIVSLAPGITESLYALDLGDKVAGVTSFCSWPVDAGRKPRVAGFRDINLEAVARNGADLAILPDDMLHYRDSLQNLGIPVMTFDVRTLAGYLRDLQNLGKVCGRERKAGEIVAEFNKLQFKNSGNASHISKPSAIFALMDPEECARPITDLTLIGKDGFYDELISAAGGVNAYSGGVPYPRVSREAIIALNPDVIIAAVAACKDKETAARNWRALGPVKAIQNNRLLFLDEAADTIPGPRALATLRKLASALSAH